MDPQMVGWFSLGGMVGLLILRVPVAFALGIMGFLGFWAISGLGPALGLVQTTTYSTIASYAFSVVPLFILMGNFAYHCGFTTDIYRTARLWLGQVPGGLAMATVVGGAAFGACSGSGFAGTSILTKITVPDMMKFGVHRRLAYGVVTSAGPLAQMIPPSILMVIYGIITEQSIAKLLIAGILPGILIAICYIVSILVRVKHNPRLAPQLEERIGWKQKTISIRSTWGIIVIFLVVIGGIYGGVFTPTEAGGIGCLATFIMALSLRKLSWRELRDSTIDAARTTGMVFLIVTCAFLFGYMLNVSRLPVLLCEFLAGLPVSRLVILISVVVMYLALGCLIDMLAAMFITLPVIFPLITSLGYDPIWFGVIMVFLCEVALVTPPFGLSLFIMQGILQESNTGEVIRGAIPFVVVDIFVLALFIAFPQIALLLPSTMGGT